MGRECQWSGFQDQVWRMTGKIPAGHLNKWNLQVGTEDWGKRGSQESMIIILSETHSSGDIEPKESTFCSQIGISVE